jgi:hypothetical protein
MPNTNVGAAVFVNLVTNQQITVYLNSTSHHGVTIQATPLLTVPVYPWNGSDDLPPVSPTPTLAPQVGAAYLYPAGNGAIPGNFTVGMVNTFSISSGAFPTANFTIDLTATLVSSTITIFVTEPNPTNPSAQNVWATDQLGEPLTVTPAS